MTARDGRAVRAVPGATSGRRDGFEDYSSGPDSSPSASPGLGSTKSSPQPRKAQFRSSAITGSYAAAVHRSCIARPGAAELGRLVGPRGIPPTVPSREPRLTISDPYPILSELEHPGTFQIVMLLDREGRANPYHMRQQLRPGQKALDRALRSLLRARLIRRVETESFPFSGNYELTDRGTKLAETMRSWPLILVE